MAWPRGSAERSTSGWPTTSPGSCSTPRSWTSSIPYASEVPHIETDHLETPSPLNPLGLKGAGEAGTIPVSAVIASAIEDAEGFPIRSMPISPAELWELRQQHTTTTDPVPAQEGSR